MSPLPLALRGRGERFNAQLAEDRQGGTAGKRPTQGPALAPKLLLDGLTPELGMGNGSKTRHIHPHEKEDNDDRHRF